MKIRYCANVTESSGYAEAARNNVASLIAAGLDVEVQVLRFEGWDTELRGSIYEDVILPRVVASEHPLWRSNVRSAARQSVLRPHRSPPQEYGVKIIHSTPDSFSRFMEPGVRNIGCTVWETDRLPPRWIPMCNLMNEIWVPCEWNVAVFRDSGVSRPIHCIPHAIASDWVEPALQIGPPFDAREAGFIFYSIFQWTERKNPIGLIKAYFSEFRRSDNVSLILKTYGSDHSPIEQSRIDESVARARSEMGMRLDETPPVKILHGCMSRSEVRALHERGDCFVLPHRSEGWGVPLFEAMALGKPTIATGFGGNVDFMNSSNSYLVRFQMTPVSHMPWVENYRGDQMWAEPDLAHLKQLMRHVFENRRDAATRGMEAKRTIQRYGWTNIGNMMKSRLVAS